MMEDFAKIDTSEKVSLTKPIFDGREMKVWLIVILVTLFMLLIGSYLKAHGDSFYDEPLITYSNNF